MTPEQEAKIDALTRAVESLHADLRLWTHEVLRLRDRVAALESTPPEAAE